MMMADLIAILSANWLLTVCIVAGALLVGVEIFLPGFGFFGITGLVLLVIGVVMSASTLSQAIVRLLIVMLLAGLLVFLGVRSATKGRLSKSALVLNDDLGLASSSVDYGVYMGKTGVTLSTLRPAGTAMIEGERLDVVTEGGFIGSNEQIVVTKVEGYRIIVEKV